jgi:hypothetical protein
VVILAVQVASGLGCIICVSRRLINHNQPLPHFGRS